MFYTLDKFIGDFLHGPDQTTALLLGGTQHLPLEIILANTKVR